MLSEGIGDVKLRLMQKLGCEKNCYGGSSDREKGSL